MGGGVPALQHPQRPSSRIQFHAEIPQECVEHACLAGVSRHLRIASRGDAIFALTWAGCVAKVLTVGHNILWSVLQEIPRLVVQGCPAEGSDVGRGAARDEARTGGDATTVKHSQAARTCAAGIVASDGRRGRGMGNGSAGVRVHHGQESRRA